MEHRSLGPYTLESLLGAGGMGEVYRAHDTVRDRRVALKVLPEAFSHDSEYSSRFRREQHIAARLRDPHIIPIHDFGQVDGRLFIDMRLVDGRDAASLLAESSLTPQQAVHLVEQTAQALDSAHAEGLVHRDVKPSNLLVTPSGFVYVVDFGIARSVGTTRTSLTVTGATVGTLDYMAPERFTTQPLDARADVYSLACLLYEFLTSRRPFPGHDLPSLMYAHFYTEPEAPSSVQPALPGALDTVVLRGMAKNPDDRFATAGELAAAAQEAVGGTTPARWSPLVTPVAAPQPEREVIDLRDAPSPLAPPNSKDDDDRTAPTEPRVPAAAVAETSGVKLGLVVAGGAHRTTDPLPAAAAAAEPSHLEAETVEAPRGRAPRVEAPPADAETVEARWPPAPVARAAEPLTVLPSPVAQAPATPAPVASAPAAQAPAAPAPPGHAYPVPPGPVPPGPVPPGPSAHGPHADGPGEQRRRRRGGALAVVVVLLLLVVGLGAGAWWLLRPDDSTPVAAGDTQPAVQTPAASPEPSTRAPIVPASSVAIPAVGPTIDVGATPGFVEMTPDGRFAYIANRDAGIVTVVDTAVNQVTARITVDAGPPQFLSFSPTGDTAYISTYRKTGEGTFDDNDVVFLDTATNKITHVVPVGQRPFASATTPDGSQLWVPSHDTGKIDVIDIASASVVSEKPVAPNPHWVAFGKDGKHVYAANHESGVVTVIDAATQETVKEIPVGKSPHSTAVSPDGTHVSVVCYDSDEVWVIDTSTEDVVATIPVDAKPQDIAYAPDGRYMYTANVDAGTVDVIDTATNTVTASIPVGGNPTSVTVRPDGKQAYVTLLDQGQVRILDVGR
ncbi:40-residue YVTN family beta-propeller repeat-containing protein [Quadrisphaera granulorum]|uniref:non-specific serine/threonine protein kinase n=1 Tax=Quadrisphaera granulorum TaxID=317664 RepID=A0A316AB37_9ACTN|nr:protein kinase [Quadrisphaera granulorum]PWJ54220.1 YVTN family beta-propeller protein [Quadrisphaera granulorum]SZE96359.1 40-residue YVTN family beta-propeller repeat-containing protein [Quadrisphaera granulorum]